MGANPGTCKACDFATCETDEKREGICSGTTNGFKCTTRGKKTIPKPKADTDTLQKCIRVFCPSETWDSGKCLKQNVKLFHPDKVDSLSPEQKKQQQLVVKKAKEEFGPFQKRGGLGETDEEQTRDGILLNKDVCNRPTAEYAAAGIQHCTSMFFLRLVVRECEFFLDQKLLSLLSRRPNTGATRSRTISILQQEKFSAERARWCDP